MKKLNLLILAVVALFAVSAQAQSYDVITTTLSSNSVTITSIAASATNSTVRSSTMLSHQQSIGVQASFALASTGTSAVVFKFDSSVDGLNWTSAAYSITVTANGTNTVSGASTFAIGGIGHVRLSSIENPNAEAMTGVTVKYARKQP